jgi:hypothetical protein
MNIITPAEAEERNIITSSEIRATIRALDAVLVMVHPQFLSRRQLGLVKSARKKLNRLVEDMMRK